MAGLNYNKIIKYKTTAICNSPLHIGSADGGKEAILIHPVSRFPFVQASSLAGAFRAFYQHGIHNGWEDELFGSSKAADIPDSHDSYVSHDSRIQFTDAAFDMATVKMENRPHVKINRETGSVSEAGNNKSGQKFELSYIGEGAKFSWCTYLYIDKNTQNVLANEFEEILSAINNHMLVLGAKKSSGAGDISLLKVLKKEFDMTDAKDRADWINEEDLQENAYEEYLSKLPQTNASKNAYQIRLYAKTEGALQVKGIAASDFGSGMPDSQNIKNAKGEDIIPGSSIRGVIRSQMEKIAGYLEKGFLVDAAFGKGGERNQEGKAGCLTFSDVIVKDQNKENLLRNRIHIDKFTGGVFYGGLFNERNIIGDVNINIDILKSENADAVAGLLLLALRDLSIGIINLGNGYATGKGFLAVSEIEIWKDAECVKINLNSNDAIEDDKKIISQALQELREVVQ